MRLDLMQVHLLPTSQFGGLSTESPTFGILRVLLLLALGWKSFVTSFVFSSFRGSQRF